MRVAARAIDFVLLTIVSFVGSLIASAALGSTFDYDAYRVASSVISLVISLGAIVYFVYGECVFGTTVGKLILGVTVRSAAGGNPTLAQSFKRNAFVLPMYLGSAISAMILLGSSEDIVGAMSSMLYGGTVGFLGTIATVGLSIALIISISNSPNVQGFHDKMAESAVVSNR
ncbi:RDD family protein [Rhodococcoides yunnanense]|uniref:RDD family protein n=1 Tax=Rhodococcoides yunnanense TaxID=278209 RepID=UPI0009334B27|nr:RDD family protein [Rhodococcus yunnanensis]